MKLKNSFFNPRLIWLKLLEKSIQSFLMTLTELEALETEWDSYSQRTNTVYKSRKTVSRYFRAQSKLLWEKVFREKEQINFYTNLFFENSTFNVINQFGSLLKTKINLTSTSEFGEPSNMEFDSGYRNRSKTKIITNSILLIDESFWTLPLSTLSSLILKECSQLKVPFEQNPDFENQTQLTIDSCDFLEKAIPRLNNLIDERMITFEVKFKLLNSERKLTEKIPSQISTTNTIAGSNKNRQEITLRTNFQNLNQVSIDSGLPALQGGAIPPSIQANKPDSKKLSYRNISRRRNTQVSFERTGLIPRSIGRTVSRFLKELGPNGEKILLQEFRISRYQLWVSIKCFFTIFFVPLFVSTFFTIVVFQPTVTFFWNSAKTDIFLNAFQEEQAFLQLHSYESEIYFQNLVSPSLNDFDNVSQKLEEQGLQSRSFIQQAQPSTLELNTVIETEHKMHEIAEEINQESINSILHLLGDFITFLTLVILVKLLQAEIVISRTFLTEILYSLSDTTKSFLIILGTDLLVGFHSPKAWEILIETILERFGLPNNEDFILLCVATVPVLLDTAFKYWIFRYLNKLSPSTVVTYHNMIE